jgi:hypothetical protein
MSKIYLADRNNMKRIRNTGELEINKGMQLFFYIHIIGKKK